MKSTTSIACWAKALNLGHGLSKEGSAPCWIARPWNDADATHTSIIVGIRPLKTESREEKMEKLLRDFIVRYQDRECGSATLMAEMFSKAKKLLEGEK